MAGGGVEDLVPGDLAVVVGVDVDEARGDQQPGGVDGLRRLTLESAAGADGDDDAVGDGHVSDERVGPRAVHDRATQ